MKCLKLLSGSLFLGEQRQGFKMNQHSAPTLSFETTSIRFEEHDLKAASTMLEKREKSYLKSIDLKRF